MKNIDLTKKNPIFDFYPAQNETIGIVSIPHSGENLPQEFKEFLVDNIKDLMQDVDYRVHELIDIKALNEAGIAVIKSNIIRTAVDLNRAKDKALLNWKTNSKGKKVVTKEPNIEQATLLTEHYYSPYYEMLKALLNELSTKFQKPSFIDLHSMPSRATEYHMKYNPNQDVIRPEFCVSDQTGKTCEPEFINYVNDKLKEEYPTSKMNNPYFGGHVTVHVDQMFPHANNIQIEISREIYMDEETQQLVSEKVNKLKPFLTQVLIQTFSHFGTDRH